jgi:hypothetical protein
MNPSYLSRPCWNGSGHRPQDGTALYCSVDAAAPRSLVLEIQILITLQTSAQTERLSSQLRPDHPSNQQSLFFVGKKNS